MTFDYIDTPEALAALGAALAGSPWIALDTEFVRERTYYPQLALIQVADHRRVTCIDPLALESLEPLLAVLYDPEVTKVLHSARQDLEIFFHLRQAPPCPVFDTQRAAALLGQGEHIGYADLVKQLLGVELDKSQTRTDWHRRPLDPAQLAYAADDVRYLREVYQHQRAALEAAGLLERLAADCASLCDPRHYCLRPEDAWRRVKGHRQLRGVQLAVLRALAAWREEQAVATDRPRRWIVGDDVLLTLARRLPEDRPRLRAVPGLAAATLKRYGDTLLELIAAARREPAEDWPRLPARASR